jgi:PleD family two-component response regulator
MNYSEQIKKIWLLVERISAVEKLGTCLEFDGYRVRQGPPEAGPVRVIVEKIEDFDPEVVVLQAEHSGFDTFELCRQLKTNAWLKPVPLIIFGKENSIQNAVKAFRAGAEYYVALAGEDYRGLLKLVGNLAEKRQV